MATPEELEYFRRCREYNRAIPFPASLGWVHVVVIVLGLLHLALTVSTLATPMVVVYHNMPLAKVIMKDEDSWYPSMKRGQYGETMKLGATGLDMCEGAVSPKDCVLQGIFVEGFPFYSNLAAVTATTSLALVATLFACWNNLMHSYPINTSCNGFVVPVADRVRSRWVTAASCFYFVAIVMHAAAVGVGASSLPASLVSGYPSLVSRVRAATPADAQLYALPALPLATNTHPSPLAVSMHAGRRRGHGYCRNRDCAGADRHNGGVPRQGHSLVRQLHHATATCLDTAHRDDGDGVTHYDGHVRWWCDGWCQHGVPTGRHTRLPGQQRGVPAASTCQLPIARWWTWLPASRARLPIPGRRAWLPSNGGAAAACRRRGRSFRAR